MLLSLAQIKALRTLSLADGVDVLRVPFDEYVLVRRYDADHYIRCYRDGRIEYNAADNADTSVSPHAEIEPGEGHEMIADAFRPGG